MNNIITKKYLKAHYRKTQNVMGISEEKKATLALTIVVLGFIMGKLYYG